MNKLIKHCALVALLPLAAFAAGLGEMHDVHPRDKTAFADLAARAL